MACFFVLLLALALPHCISAAGGGGGESASLSNSYSLSGSGASTFAPLMTNWIFSYRAVAPTVDFSYTGSSSGAGQSEVLAGKIDFGGSNTLFSSTSAAAKRKTDGTPSYWALLISMSSIVLQFNIPGLLYIPRFSTNRTTTTATLPTNPSLLPVLTRANLVDIYVGNILNWNDPRIAASQTILNLKSNVGYIFPNLPIKIAYRTDSSGTVTTFLTALALINQTAIEKAGLYSASSGIPRNTDLTTVNGNNSYSFFRTSSPNYGLGVPSTGNGQTSFKIGFTAGSIGAVSLPFMASGSTYFQLVNANGDIVLPTSSAIQKAFEYGYQQGSLTRATSPSLAALSSTIVNEASPLGNLLYAIDSKAPQSWPLAEANFILIPDTVNSDCFRALEINQFLLWGLQSSLSSSAQTFLNYVPVVGAMQRKLMDTIVNTKCGTGSDLVFNTIFPYEQSILQFAIAMSIISAMFGFITIWKRNHPAIQDNGFWILLGACSFGFINYYTVFLWIGYPTTPICQARPWVASISFMAVFGWIAISLQEKILTWFENNPTVLLGTRIIGVFIIIIVNLLIPLSWWVMGPPDGSFRLCAGPVEATMRQVTILYNLVIVCAAAFSALLSGKKSEYTAFPIFMFVLLSALFVPLSFISAAVTGSWDSLPPRDGLSVVLSPAVGIVVSTLMSNVFMVSTPFYRAFTMDEDEAAVYFASKKETKTFARMMTSQSKSSITAGAGSDLIRKASLTAMAAHSGSNTSTMAAVSGASAISAKETELAQISTNNSEVAGLDKVVISVSSQTHASPVETTLPQAGSMEDKSPNLGQVAAVNS